MTKYGLQLGLALPAIAECDSWTLEADVRWGAERRPVRFSLEGRAPPGGGEAVLSGANAVRPAEAVLSSGTNAGRPAAPGALEIFTAAFDKLGSDWRIERDPAVLDLPGVGLCIPDLAFERELGGRAVRVYLEVLGFWSREAVWRRVDLVRAGLPHRILFAVSRDLRVSEEILQDASTAALYVFTRVLAARAVLGRLDALAA